METAPGAIGEAEPGSRAVLYARVSTEEQAASGLGVAAQLHACRERAGRDGREVAGQFVDPDVGGATPLNKRPALLAAVDRLEPGDVLLVAKRDRLGRDPIVVATIETVVARKKCRIVSAAGEGTESDAPTDVMMRRMVDAFGEYERLVIKARTKAALAAKRRRGELCGNCPYGWDVDDDGVHLVMNPGEMACIVMMRQWRAAGLSFRAIAHELNRHGVRTKHNSAWRHSSVISILASAARNEVA